MKKNKMLYRIVAAVLACAVVALALVTYQSRSSSNAPVAEGAVTATGSAKGMEGDVVVEVTADATTIYSITVKEQNETQGIGSVVCEQLPDTMVAANSYNVDGIAGATVTSDALKEAVKAALTSAGLDASAFAVAQTSDAAVEKTAESLDCDVVIVGAGGAGLTAAAQAAENGAKVIVVEKMPIVGGNSLKATGGMNAADTKYQEALGITDSGVDEFIEDTWNAAVAAGEDKEFGRSNGMDADLSTAPYYAIKIAPGIHHTMGGLKINTDAEVLDTQGNVIPGLYAAGETTGGVHGGNRIGGNAVCDFVVFGRIAGNNASAYAAN